MSTITKELAKLFRKITNSEIDAEGNAHVVLSPADSLLINNARIALASLEAEPVAWKVAFKLEGQPGSNCDKIFESRPAMNNVVSLHERGGFIVNVTPLYAAPQPATAVLDASVMADNHISWLNENFPRKTFTDEEWEEVSLYTWLAWRDACRSAMLQGAEPKCHDVIDKNLIEALRLVQCMLDDYRERNYGDAERWIRHINTHMSDYSEAHGNDAYSVLHDLLTAAPQQEVKK